MPYNSRNQGDTLAPEEKREGRRERNLKGCGVGAVFVVLLKWPNFYVMYICGDVQGIINNNTVYCGYFNEFVAVVKGLFRDSKVLRRKDNQTFKYLTRHIYRAEDFRKVLEKIPIFLYPKILKMLQFKSGFVKIPIFSFHHYFEIGSPNFGSA